MHAVQGRHVAHCLAGGNRPRLFARVCGRGAGQRGKQQLNRHASPAVARPQDGPDRLVDTMFDADDARASDDGASNTSISSACGGSGGFACARGGFGGSAPGGLVVLASDVTHAPQARPQRLMSLHAEVLSAAATMAPSARRQPLVEAPPAGSMPAPTSTRKVVALGRARISPLKKLSASAKSNCTKIFLVISTFRSTLGPRWVNRGSPIFGGQPWVPAQKSSAVGPRNQFSLLRVLGNQTKLSTFDTVAFRVRRRPDRFHALRCALPLHSPCQKFGNTDYFFKIPAKAKMHCSMKHGRQLCHYSGVQGSTINC
jgi:hypothetical protein